MKLRGEFPLAPDDALRLRNVMLKGVGAVTLIVVFIAMAAAVLRPQTGDLSAVALDVVAILALMATIRGYSLRQATERLEMARVAKQKQDAPRMISLLAGFARPTLLAGRSRFDRTGEAHYLLAWASARCGEPEMFAYCQTFLSRFRRTEWTKKALKLKMPE